MLNLFTTAIPAKPSMTSEVMDSVLPPLNTDSRTVSVRRAHFWNGGRYNMRRTTSIVIVLISLLAFIPSQGQAKDTSVVLIELVDIAGHHCIPHYADDPRRTITR